MSTDRLGDARRAIGTRMERERRAADPGAARRANGARIERERTGAAVQDDINSLVRPVAVRKQLATVPPVGALPAQRGRADYKAPAAASTGGGIASPLTEQSYAEREWHAEKTLKSSDGLLSFRVKAIKQLRTTDADDVEVIMIYKEPPA